MNAHQRRVARRGYLRQGLPVPEAFEIKFGLGAPTLLEKIERIDGIRGVRIIRGQAEIVSRRAPEPIATTEAKVPWYRRIFGTILGFTGSTASA